MHFFFVGYLCSICLYLLHVLHFREHIFSMKKSLLTLNCQRNVTTKWSILKFTHKNSKLIYTVIFTNFQTLSLNLLHLPYLTKQKSFTIKSFHQNADGITWCVKLEQTRCCLNYVCSVCLHNILSENLGKLY